MKQLLRAAEEQFDFMGLAVIGPGTGPVRFLLSRDPRERLRVSNANCALASVMHWERYASAGAAQRLWDAVARLCAGQEMVLAGKRDWFRMTPGAMVSVIERLAARLAVGLLAPEDKRRVLLDAQRKVVDRYVPPEPRSGLHLRRGTVRTGAGISGRGPSA